jgi:hypothetical protein
MKNRSSVKKVKHLKNKCLKKMHADKLTTLLRSGKVGNLAFKNIQDSFDHITMDTIINMADEMNKGRVR